MATIEFIQKRIEGKEKELEKLNKKLERILKAKETNWEVNPYWYREEDIRYTNRDIENCQKSLQDYKDQLEKENQKAQSRNIPVILEFLDNWKARMMQYYISAFDQYVIELKEYYDKDKEYCKWYDDEGFNMRRTNRAEYDRISKEHESAKREFHSKWSFMVPYVDSHFDQSAGCYVRCFNETKFQKDLDQEANAKYDFIIDRTNQIVKVITDATNLRIGAKGDLNGFIIGTGGTAKVTTIGAGGYNIQCYHFRTLVSPFKG